MKIVSARPLALLTLLSCFASAEPAAEASEPLPKGDKVIPLISDQSLKGWKAPSNRWSIKNGVITGDTIGEELKTPEWLYTNETYSDFIFSAEIRLSGGPKADSGNLLPGETLHLQTREVRQ